MKLFFDTNILLDVFLARVPHLSSAQIAWSLVETKQHKAAISAISVNNVYYILQKLGTRKKAETAIGTLLDIFDVTAVDKAILQNARKTAHRDYEDAIQYLCAQHYGADFLLSRNAKDYPNATISILSCDEFLARE